MTNSYKKESPLAGFPGFGGGAGALYYKSGSEKIYLEDVFSIDVWEGNATARTINNGVKLGNSNAGNSVEFDGTGDYLSIGGGTDMELGTGDFTIETFAYFNSVSSGQIYEGRPNGVQGAYISIYMDNNNLVFYTDSATRITSSAISANQWYHIAYSCDSTTIRAFLDGTLKETATGTSDFHQYSNSFIQIGRPPAGFGSSKEMKGKGRHDPCVVPRAVPIVESMAALVILDNMLINNSNNI